MYEYYGFGLNIASEIEFPELLPAKFAVPDITITTGEINKEIQGERSDHKDCVSIISNTEYYLDIIGVCKYHVPDHAKIIIEPYPGIDSRSIRLFLLGSVMAFVLFKKGMIPLHASAIIKNNRLVLFTGDSGAGKSTTLAQLAIRGHTVFTDDICVINKDSLGIASYPMIKLWDDALTKLNNDTYREKDFRIKPDLDKYGYFFYDNFYTDALPIDKIFVIKVDTNLSEPTYRALTGLKAFDALAKQVYRRYLLIGDDLKKRYFKTIANLANSCKVIEISRPANADPLVFIDKLELLINDNPTDTP